MTNDESWLGLELQTHSYLVIETLVILVSSFGIPSDW